MRVEVIRGNELEREQWVFTLSVDTQAKIYFDSYIIGNRESIRHRIWRHQKIWNRIMSRDNTIQTPPLPQDVEVEMRINLSSQVKALPIQR
jgi:hypothetical protein